LSFFVRNRRLMTDETAVKSLGSEDVVVS
jgi:hypothetical protein